MSIRIFLRHAFCLTPIKRNLSIAVVLPEIINYDSGGENNPLILNNNALHPPLSTLNSQQLYNGIGHLCIRYDIEYNAFENELKSANLTLQEVFSQIEKLSSNVSRALIIAKLLNKLEPNVFSSTYKKILLPMQRISMLRFKSQITYQTIKKLKDELGKFENKPDSNTPYLTALADKFIAQGEMNGLSLIIKDYEKVQYNLNTLEQQKEKFIFNMNISRMDAAQLITDKSEIIEMPDKYLKQYLHNLDSTNFQTGPWVITFEPENYNTFISYVGNERHRQSLYNIYHSMATTKNISHNGRCIDEILHARHDIAKCLSYPCYMDLSLSQKMAKSRQEILQIIEELRTRIMPRAISEMETLTAFSDQESKLKSMPELSLRKADLPAGGGLFSFAKKDNKNSLLNAWNVPYWRRRYVEKYFHKSLLPQFEYNGQLNDLFQLLKDMFGIKFEKIVPNPPELSYDYECYEIRDQNNGLTSHLYINPVWNASKPKFPGIWAELGQNKSVVRNDLPYAILSLDLAFNQDSQLLMTYNQLKQLYFNMGHLLPHLLTRVPYSEIAGLNYVERDCEYVMAYFMEKFAQFCITKQGMIDKPIVSDILKRDQFMKANDTMSELLYSHLDIELHSGTNYYYDVFRKIYPLYMTKTNQSNTSIPSSFDPLATFTPIFIDAHLTANYYSKLWAPIIAEDLFTHFKTATDVTKNGKNLLEKYVSIGSSIKQRTALTNFTNQTKLLKNNENGSSEYKLNIEPFLQQNNLCNIVPINE